MPANFGANAEATSKQLQRSKEEYEAVIHFQKCYAVLQEIFVEFQYFLDILPGGFKFLDLGCAPGGFSSFLLDDERCGKGFGVSLPAAKGGFPMRLRSDHFLWQPADLFEITPDGLVAPGVNFFIFDAHYLRDDISTYGKYRGVKCRSRQHGVWALLCKQCWLGMSKLLHGGVMVFRFGWRSNGDDDELTAWYRRSSLRLFALMEYVFERVRWVKSGKWNSCNGSFYVVCASFRADRFAECGMAQIFRNTFEYLMTSQTEDPTPLDVLAAVDHLPGVRTAEVDAKTNEMLDRVDKQRLAHWQEKSTWRRPAKQECVNLDAVVFMAPVPTGLSPFELREKLRVYGWVKEIDMDAAGCASIRFANMQQARDACAALRAHQALGEGVEVWLRDEEDPCSRDAWQTEDFIRAAPTYDYGPMADDYQGMSWEAYAMEASGMSTHLHPSVQQGATGFGMAAASPGFGRPVPQPFGEALARKPLQLDGGKGRRRRGGRGCGA